MKVQINKNIQFTGYKNVISHAFSNREAGFMYMGMQLNDEDGFKDLSEFRKIQNRINSRLPQDDNILTFTCARYWNSPETLFYDMYRLRPAQELKKYQNELTDETFRSYEATNLKIYTLLASITKRIMSNPTPKLEANGAAKIIDKYIKSTNFIANDSETIISFIHSSIHSPEPLQEVAYAFNQIIKDRMAKYFKL